MTRCVELPTSIWSSLMLWTRLGVREVRWRRSFSESNSVGLLLWPPVLFPYIYCIPPSPHRWPDRSLQLLSSRSTFNLWLPKSMQGAKSVRNQPPLRDCHGTSFSDHNLRSTCCKPEPTNECSTQAVVACARSTSWYTCNIDSRACRCPCTRTPICCCCRRACHKPPTKIINVSGTKRLWDNWQSPASLQGMQEAWTRRS
jgi:hypothetical protein